MLKKYLCVILVLALASFAFAQSNSYVVTLNGISDTDTIVITVNGATDSIDTGHTKNVGGLDVYVEDVYFFTNISSSAKIYFNGNSLTSVVLSEGQSYTFTTSSAPADTTPPSPTLTSATTGADSASVGITTDEPATCRYSASPNMPYASMTGNIGSGFLTAHTAVFTNLTPGNYYTFYVRCADQNGNANQNDYVIGPFSIPPVACTADAKLCPDGSYVGRTGTNCEFEECPATNATVYCKDSDGDNIYVKGYVRGYESGTNNVIEKTDYCDGEKSVVEYFCVSSANYVYSAVKDCPYGCREGACVKESQIYVKPTSDLKAKVNQPYHTSFVARGGTPPYKWEVINGALPPGLSLQDPPAIGAPCTMDESGVTNCPPPPSEVLLTGTPTRIGTFKFRLTAKDANGLTGGETFVFYVVGEEQRKTFVSLSTDKYKYAQNEKVTIKAYASGSNLSGLQVTAVIYKPDGSTDRVLLEPTERIYGDDANVITAKVTGYTTYAEPASIEPYYPHNVLYFSGVYENTNIFGDYKVTAESNQLIETQPARFTVFNSELLEKYLILHDIGDYKFITADARKDTFEGFKAAMYAAQYASGNSGATAMVLELNDRSEGERMLNWAKNQGSGSGYGFEETTIEGNNVLIFRKNSESIALWSHGNFIIMIQGHARYYTTQTVAGQAVASKVEVSPVTAKVTESVETTSAALEEDVQICPAICLPMWKKTEVQCVTAPCYPVCEYTECGSGCGPDGKTTFETEVACKESGSGITCPSVAVPACEDGYYLYKKTDDYGCVVSYECKPIERNLCQWRPSGDYGNCEAVLGIIYYNGEECIRPSGCGSGGDASPFSTIEQCKRECTNACPEPPSAILCKDGTHPQKVLNDRGCVVDYKCVEDERPYCGPSSYNENCYCKENEIKERVPCDGEVCVAAIRYRCTPKETSSELPRAVVIAYLEKYPSDLGVVHQEKDVSNEELLEIAFRLENLWKRFDELQKNSIVLANYYRSINDTASAARFDKVADLFEQAKDKVDEIKNKIRSNLDTPELIIDEVRGDIKELRSFLREILLTVLGAGEEADTGEAASESAGETSSLNSLLSTG